MGMDFVEVTCAIEQRFGVKITADNWETLRLQQPVTVEKLADWVWGLLPLTQRAETEADAAESANLARSFEEVALRWLQEQLRDILAIAARPEVEFAATHPLNQLPGNLSMRSLYAALRRRGVELPPLFASSAQKAVIGGIAILAAVMTSASADVGKNMFHLWLLYGALAGAFTWAGLTILVHRFLAATSTADTVGELAAQLFFYNPGFFSRQAGIKITHQRVRAIVIQILVEILPVDREEVILSARLVEDLGMD